jgi:DNA-binding GntR family transcriptional regulator
MIYIYELKEALDKMAVKLCILRKTEELMEQLGTCIEAHGRALENNDYNLVAEKDNDFHIAIIMGTKNPRLENISQTVMLQTRRLSQVSVFDPTCNKVFFEQHKKIYAAIKEDRVEDAERAVTEHTEYIKSFLTVRFDRFF